MLQQRVLVQAIDQQWLYLKSDKNSACSACQTDAPCTTTLLLRWLMSEREHWLLPVRDGVVVGHYYWLKISSVVLRRIIILSYGLPLLLLMLAALAGEAIYADFGAIAGAVVGLSLSFFVHQRLVMCRWMTDAYSLSGAIELMMDDVSTPSAK